MSWTRFIREPGHINEAISHYNHALDRLAGRASKVEVSSYLFHALNKIQTEFMLHEDDQTMGEVKAFQTMILKGFRAGDRAEFLYSEELKRLVLFKTQIMNHDTLRRHGYRPDIEINQNLIKYSTQEHQKFVIAYKDLDLQSQRDKEIENRVLKRAAELLYVVRSNIAHGEKTPYGPDLKKSKRDEQVCAVVMPLQFLLFDLLLDSPERKLIVYGTLAPGEPNHHIISDLEGEWDTCIAEGDLIDFNGLMLFRWKPSGKRLEMKLFISPDLPKQWAKIDKFEGFYYKRRLIAAETDRGVSVANIYVDAREGKIS
jgi:gamma-glutamylcyclotransferase (GGCT)/AIG2-like uncharacterized protein YtfP